MAAKVTSSATSKLAVANTEFAIDMYKQLSKETPNENIFFSPLSVSVCLAMAYAGTRGETAEQMKKTLHFDEVPDDQLNATIGDVTKLLNSTSGDVALQMANKLYGGQGYSFLKEFLDSLKNDFGAELEQVGIKLDKHFQSLSIYCPLFPPTWFLCM